MIVTLLYFKGCPNWHEADAHLRVLATEIPGMEITRRLVETPEDASTLSVRTVETHRTHVQQKLDSRNLAELIRIARLFGLVDDDLNR